MVIFLTVNFAEQIFPGYTKGMTPHGVILETRGYLAKTYGYPAETPMRVCLYDTYILQLKPLGADLDTLFLHLISICVSNRNPWFFK